MSDIASKLEFEFFRSDSPTAKLKDQYGAGADNVRGLKVEDLVKRLVEQLMPLLDRSNRMMLRNLKALRALREAAPSVSIGSAQAQGRMIVAEKKDQPAREKNPAAVALVRAGSPLVVATRRPRAAGGRPSTVRATPA